MQHEVKESFYLALSLAIAATFVMLIVLFSHTAAQIRYKSDERIAKTARMEQEADIYKFISSGNVDNPEKLVTGSDIIRFISKNTTRYKYQIWLSNTEHYDIDYDSELHTQCRDMYLEAMGYVTPDQKKKSSADQYYTADMALWSQSYLSDYILKEIVYESYVPYVIMDNEVTENIDDIIDNSTLVTFVFKLKQ